MRIVRRGTWLYDGSALAPVDVISLPHDFWHELAAADGTVEPGETAMPLGPDGVLYYYRFAHADRSAAWPDSGAHPTAAGAMSAAERRVGAPVTWK